MNIELMAINALDFIKKNNLDFPKKGIIAGGSLANIVWEKVSGNVAKINDIDVFIFKNKLEIKDISYNSTITNDGRKIFYQNQENYFYEDYNGFCQGTRSKDFYLIENTENKGIYNYIHYSSTSDSLELVINSFDINCTQIGYDIESNRFYWTKEFEDFLKTGKLKFTNLGSPQHSSIRIFKKRDDLNAILDPDEIKMTAYVISRPLSGVTRRYFSNKYFETFKKYHKELDKYFNIKSDKEISNLISIKKGIQIDIYTLESAIKVNDLYGEDPFLERIWNINDFLFYKRNIEKSDSLKKIWAKISYLFNETLYLDSNPSEEDIDFLYRVTYNAPNIIKNIKGLTISEQLKLIKRLFDKFKNDLSIPIALLEKGPLNPDMDLDDDTCLLLELSVRVDILNNSYKIDRILGQDKTTDDNNIIDMNLEF